MSMCGVYSSVPIYVYTKTCYVPDKTNELTDVPIAILEVHGC